MIIQGFIYMKLEAIWLEQAVNLQDGIAIISFI